MAGNGQGLFVHSFKCARCRLEFMVLSGWAERHTAFNVSCPECGSVGAFLHYRAALPGSFPEAEEEVWPWKGSARLFDSVVYPIPAGEDGGSVPEGVDRVELSQEFSALHAGAGDGGVEIESGPQPAARANRSLGQILTANGSLSEDQLELALEAHRISGRSLGRNLVDLGLIEEKDLVRALAEQLGIDFVDLSETGLDRAAAALLSRTFAERYRAIPVREQEGALQIAMSDPTNVFALEDLRTITGREVRPAVATAADIEAAIGWLSTPVLPEPRAIRRTVREIQGRRRLGDRDERDTASDLQRALQENELRLHYLPIVDLTTARIWGVEALVRWDHPTRGFLGPPEFIPLAEESGMIVPVGRWVLHQACREGVRLQQQNGRPLDISVNVSTLQLEERDLAEQFARVLGETGLHPRTLIVDITETARVRDMEAAVATLNDLKSLGVRLAVDNFGRGYASLEYVHRFPIDILKIHGSFIDSVTQGGESAALSAAVIELAGILRFQRIAVGIERADQVRLLRRLGCDAAEGSYFGLPIPAEGMAELLRAKSTFAGPPGESREPA